MTGVSVQFEDQVRPVLNRLLAAGRNPRPLLLGLARIGENQTRERFRTEIDPNGQRWDPSRRASDQGGKTLTGNGILAGSITSDATIEYAEWGTNMEYAAIHQFGGVIRPVRAKFLAVPITDAARAVPGPRHFPGHLTVAQSLKGQWMLLDPDTGEVHYLLKKSVEIPARAFLGLSAQNRDEMLTWMNKKLTRLMEAA
ncbi:MAG TPA: phage virion morphogenesis protein [Fluviicoccus sp.]|nr:phage virion morphogenesis protein [Fluviicoccus sp.]